MKNLIKAALLSALLMAGPALADSTTIGLAGALKGTTVTPAAGSVEVVDNGGHQYLKFSQQFAVASQAETEVRHIDAQTGEMTFIGNLVSRKGYQVYEMPEGVKVDKNDQIVLFSPLHAEDLATVDFSDD